jgi:acyl carrier protein
MDRAALTAEIHEFLKTELGGKYKNIDTSTPLVTTGLLDSVGLVRLAALLEAETGLVIPDRDVTAEHFDTIDKIHAYVADRRTHHEGTKGTEQ